MNKSVICLACQKEIVDEKMRIEDSSYYKPVHCVVEKEARKTDEYGISVLEDNLYHYSCYKIKVLDEAERVSKNLGILGRKR
jgi:hypothetical protein